MRLEKFRVKGFRCLEDVDWIPIKKLTVFTGENNGGKTSALEALAIFLNPKSAPDDADYTMNDGHDSALSEIIIEGSFRITDSEKAEIDVRNRQLEIRRLFKKNEKESNSPFLFKTLVHPDVRLQKDLDSLKVDELIQLAADFSIPLTAKRPKESIVSEIETWRSQQTLQEGWLQLPVRFFSRLPDIKIFSSAGASDPQNEINSTLKNSFVTRIKGESYSGRLNEMSTQIEGEMRQDLEKFVPILKQYCPDVSEVQIDPSFDFSSGFRTSRLLLKASSGPLIDLAKQGEGRRQRITLAIYEWRERLLEEESDSPNEQTIVAFDEPDTHLDYLSQRKIFDIIKRISKPERMNVVVCTHSLNLIDRIPLTDIVHLELNPLTRIVTMTSDDSNVIDLFMLQISENMGLRNSIMLNERCFLAIEGLTEIMALPVIFNLMYGYPPQAGGVRILNGGGGAGAKLFAKFLNEQHRNVIFMVDSDTKTNPKNRYFTPESLEADGIRSEQINFIGTREFEDAFADEIYARAANQFWKKADATAWTVEEFKTLRDTDDFADNLLKMVRSATRSNIGKPEIGFGLAKSLLQNEIPAQIKDCLEKAHGRANDESTEEHGS